MDLQSAKTAAEPVILADEAVLDNSIPGNPPVGEATLDPSTLDQSTASTDTDQRPLRRRVFDLAWPVISENFLQTMLGIIDTVMVAQLGAVALAGVGAAIQIMFFVISALSATSVGSSVLVAQAIGAKAYPDAVKYAKQSLVWSVLISIPLVLIGLFAVDPLIAIFRMEPEVNVIGEDYLRVTMGTVVVLTLMLLSGGVLRGAGDSRTPMTVTAVANVVNVVISYGLIFGQLGMPELGAVGSAWGTFVSRAVGCGLLFYVMRRGVNGVHIRGKDNWLPDLHVARNILKIGVPAAVEQVLTSTAFLTMSIVVAQLGTLALAAHRIVINSLSLSFLPGFGFALAATALVGQSIGAKRPDEGRAVARISTIWAIGWMGALGVIFFFFGGTVMRIFTQEPEAIRIGAASLRAVALAQPFWAISFVQSGALRGTGDTQYPLRVGTTGIWAATLIGAFVVTFLGGGLSFVWGSFLLTAPLVSLLMWRKFRHTISEQEITTTF